MPDRDYRKDSQLREGITELLADQGYSVEQWTLADKPTEGDEERVLTLKAARSLNYAQERMKLGKAE